MKRLLLALALLGTTLLTGCRKEETADDGKSPLTIGELRMGSDDATRAVGEFAFTNGDAITVTATPATSGTTYTASYRLTAGNWAAEGTPIYIENVKQGYSFAVGHGDGAFTADQSTRAKHKTAYHIDGPATLSGTALSSSELEHQNIQVVVNIRVGEWAESTPFADYMAASAIRIKTVSAGDIIPLGEAESTTLYSLRANLPTAELPASGSVLLTLTPSGGSPLNMRYTLPSGTSVTAGMQVRVNAVYGITPETGELLVTGVTLADWATGTPIGLQPEEDKAIYRIYNETDLRAVQAAIYAGTMPSEVTTILLCADIDMGGREMQAIADDDGYFRYHFDGQGHTVSNVNMAHVESSSQKDAGFLGTVWNGHTIVNLHVTGTVTGSDESETVTGGLCSRNLGPVIASSFVGTVSTGDDLGGISGANMSVIIGCYFSGSLAGGSNSGIGGIAGTSIDGTFTGCYSVAPFDRTDNGTGGILGYDFGSVPELDGCFWLSGTNAPTVAMGNLSGLGSTPTGCASFTDKDDFAAQKLMIQLNNTLAALPEAENNYHYELPDGADYPVIVKGPAVVTLPGIYSKADLMQFAADIAATNGMYPVQSILDQWADDNDVINLWADIDMESEEMKTIGTGGYSPLFSYHFNGNGHTVSNVKMIPNGTEGGFFGIVSENYGHIEYLHISGKITGDEYAGGIASANNGTIEGCSFEGTVTSTNAAGINGGIVGTNGASGLLRGCYVRARTEITGGLFGGGIAGSDVNTITGCYSSAYSVSGTLAGGLAGYGTSLSYSYWAYPATNVPSTANDDSTPADTQYYSLADFTTAATAAEIITGLNTGLETENSKYEFYFDTGKSSIEIRLK